MLFIFSSHPFYMKHVSLPGTDDPVSPQIYDNPKVWPYFKDALGTLDGSHIHSAPPASEHPVHRNHKGFILQNCLFGCSFDLQFIYSLTGWEGSASDALIYEDACPRDLNIPDGKYYLADARFPACQQLLIPYYYVRYHLTEWGHVGIRYVSSHITSNSLYTVVVDLQTRKNYLIFTIPQLIT